MPPTTSGTDGKKSTKSGRKRNEQKLKRLGKTRPIFRLHVARMLKEASPEKMTASALTVSTMNDMCEYLLERISHASNDVVRSYAGGKTLSASVVKGGIGLVLPFQARDEVYGAGLSAVHKLQASRAK